FDEPLSNLDAKLRVSMRVEIRKLQRAFATTSIYVTHDQLEAMTLADLLVVMNAGQVEQIGPPLAVYEKPATTFVAAFIGAPPMNLIAVSAAEAAVLAPGHAVPEEGAIVGVRPDELKLAAAQAGPPAGLGLDLAVTAVERVGPESFVYGTPAVGRGEGIVRVPGTQAPAPGEQVRAGAASDRRHPFAARGPRLPARRRRLRGVYARFRPDPRVSCTLEPWTPYFTDRGAPWASAKSLTRTLQQCPEFRRFPVRSCSDLTRSSACSTASPRVPTVILPTTSSGSVAMPSSPSVFASLSRWPASPATSST